MNNMFRYTLGPVVKAGFRTNGWYSDHAANPTTIEFNNQIFMYIRGISQGGPSSLGVWTAPKLNFDGFTWNKAPVTNPILTASTTSGTVDFGGIYDPCAVVFQNKVFMYYMGTGTGTSRVLLATSTDGFAFTKNASVSIDGGTPAAVVDASGVLHLFYTKGDSTNGWKYYKRTSSDGISFGSEVLVFSPSGVTGTFDFLSVITARVIKEDNWYYLIYGGSPVYDDYPEGLGLARSTDLVTWERYSQNPILLRGPAGTWDEGALWSGTPLVVNGVLYMWYEGVGSNAGGGSANSNTARDAKYGGYNTVSFSQIGFAVSKVNQKFADYFADVNIADGDYYIINESSGKMLSSTGTSVILSGSDFNTATKWTVSKKTTGFYLISVSSSFLTAGNSGDRSDGVQAAFQASTGNQYQEWFLQPCTKFIGNEGIFNIINRYTGKNLQIDNTVSNDGVAVLQRTPMETPNNRWLMVKA